MEKILYELKIAKREHAIAEAALDEWLDNKHKLRAAFEEKQKVYHDLLRKF